MITFLTILHLVSIYQLYKAYKWKKSSRWADERIIDYFFEGEDYMIIWLYPIFGTILTDIVLLTYSCLTYLP